MSKIKVHPNNQEMYMLLNMVTDEPNACYISTHDDKTRYLSDCTHSMAGKTVNMVDFPEDW